MTTNNERDLLAEIARNTRVIAALLARSVARDEVRSQLSSVLESPERMRVYESSDGSRSAREVGRLASVSDKTVGAWWKEWAIKGLVVEESDTGRMKATHDLGLLGLGTPK